VPLDDVEELGAAEMVEESPVAIAVEEEPAPAVSGEAQLQIRVRELEQQIESLRAEHRAELDRIVAQLNDLADGIRSRL
jgi:hypothetical protein